MNLVAPGSSVVALLRHDNVAYEDQTVYLSGNAFFGCDFRRCTFVLTGSIVFHCEKCEFHSCIWHVDMLLHDISQAQALIAILQNIAINTIPKVEPAPDSGQKPESAQYPPVMVGKDVRVGFPVFVLLLLQPDRAGAFARCFVGCGEKEIIPLFSSFLRAQQFANEAGIVIDGTGSSIHRFDNPLSLADFLQEACADGYQHVTIDPPGQTGARCASGAIAEAIAAVRAVVPSMP